MGIFDNLDELLSPHVHKLHESLNLHGALIHQRLKAIEDRVADLGRPDVGDRWHDMFFSGELAAGERKEIGVVPMNEIWSAQGFSVLQGNLIESIAVRANGRLRIVAGNAVATFVPSNSIYPGGNVVFLPGEVITVEIGVKHPFEMSLTVTRNLLPVANTTAETGHAPSILVGRNTHDPARDVIVSRTDRYVETPPEVTDPGGHPEHSHLDPTAV